MADILNGSYGMIALSSNLTVPAYTTILNLTSCDISQEMATRDVTTKTSAGNKEVLEGMMSWSGSASGFFENEDATGHALFQGYLANRTKLLLKYTEFDATGATAESGSTNYIGHVFITSLSRTDGLEDSATYEVSFEGTGALAASTN